MKADNSDLANKALGRPDAPGQTELARDTDPISAHVGTGPDGYDKDTTDYSYIRRIPVPKSTDSGDGPKVAKRESGTFRD